MLRAISICVTASLASMTTAQDELARRASWQPPQAQDVRLQTLEWVGGLQDLDARVLSQVDALWPREGLPDTNRSLLEQVAVTVAVIHPEARDMMDLCRREPPALLPPSPEFLLDESIDPFVRNNLRLHYAIWLSQHAYYDEALEQLQELTPPDVVDPASLLFYRGVAQHRLLQKDECLASVRQLLENEALLPRRYLAVAKLMEADIKPLEVDSLDEIARLMEDIRRRLNLGRAGTRVRQEEDDVIAKLDKMIEQLEQQQQQQQASASGGGNTQSSRPAEQSGNLGGSGPGDIDQKRLKNEADWGNLPPKDRQEALQQISKDLPAHYREVIEEYFRKLARDGDE